MKKILVIWIMLFIIGMLLILQSYDLSRFLSNEYACVTAGAILSVLSGAGMLLELYRKN